MRGPARGALLLWLCALLLLGCGSGDLGASEQGRRVYAANCIACHHVDPRIDGALGPPIAGASLELLEARVLRGEYPLGYRPKRPTQLMQPLPYLADELEVLFAYLDSLEP